MGQMNSYLMSPPRLEAAPQFADQGRIAKGSYHLVMRDSRAGARRTRYCNLLSVGSAAGERRIDRAAPSLRHAPDERQIFSLEPSVAAVRSKLRCEPLMRAIGLGDNEEAARILVEAMHDAGAHDTANAGKARTAMGDEGVDQCSPAMAGRRVHDKARGLVDDDKGAILIDDGERQRLGLRDGRNGSRDMNAHAHFGFEPELALAYRNGLDTNIAIGNKGLEACPAYVWKARRKPPVKALAFIGGQR